MTSCVVLYPAKQTLAGHRDASHHKSFDVAVCSFRYKDIYGPSHGVIWLWVKNWYPEWNPGKWTHGLKPAVP